MSGAILRRRDRTARSLRVVHYSSAVNTGLGISGCGDPGADAALRDAEAEPALYRGHAGQAPSGAGGAEEGGGHRRAQRLGTAASAPASPRCCAISSTPCGRTPRPRPRRGVWLISPRFRSTGSPTPQPPIAARWSTRRWTRSRKPRRSTCSRSGSPICTPPSPSAPARSTSPIGRPRHRRRRRHAHRLAADGGGCGATPGTCRRLHGREVSGAFRPGSVVGRRGRGIQRGRRRAARRLRPRDRGGIRTRSSPGCSRGEIRPTTGPH